MAKEAARRLKITCGNGAEIELPEVKGIVVDGVPVSIEVLLWIVRSDGSKYVQFQRTAPDHVNMRWWDGQVMALVPRIDLAEGNPKQ